MCTQISRKTAPRVTFVGAGDLCTLKWNVLGVLLLFFLNQCGTGQLCYFAISIDKTFCLNTVHTELVSFIFSVILLYESASMVTLFLCPPPPLFYTRVPLFIPVFGSCGESCLSVTVLSDPVPALAEGEMMTVRDFPAIICGVSNSQGVMSSQPVWVSHLFFACPLYTLWRGWPY